MTDAGDLRYCINQANADDQANTIVFDSTLFSMPQTITVSGVQLALTDTGGTQTITGPAAGVTISGGAESPVYQVDPGVTASISGLTISGGGTSSGHGGGLANYGTATYNGAADFVGMSSSATAESVRQATTAIVLVPHAVLKGKKTLSAVSLTAEIKPVAPGGGVPTGQVTFELVTKRGKKTQVKTLGAAAAEGGAASLTFKPSAVLNKTLTIVYSGDPDFLASMMNPPRLTKTGIASSGI
ncbi:MAG: Ig-like domain repeat protein [Isosphaeraceae bacterium]